MNAVNVRVGIGFDLHRLGQGSALIIGGVEIPHHHKFIAHSDGDVLSHAITDALLGAAGIGNIGELFPDSDQKFKGMSSLVFLRETARLLREKGYRIGNIDSNVLAEQPKLLRHFPAMKEKIAEALEMSVEDVHIKAKTMEGVGEIGEEEAIAAHAVVLIYANS